MDKFENNAFLDNANKLLEEFSPNYSADDDEEENIQPDEEI